VSELLMIERAGEDASAAPWILDAEGRRTPAYDDARRLAEVRDGLTRDERVTAHVADVSREDVERAVRALHDSDYLDALGSVRDGDAVLVPELAQPGLEPDTPVCAESVASAHESVGIALAAARRILEGARFSYALCRPPGHHAGPAWLGGYCFLNNAAAAAQALRDGGFAHVAILDLDLHYPNGTAALVERMRGTSLHSLHGATGANLPWHRVRARCDREHLVSFKSPPSRCTAPRARGERRRDRALARLRHRRRRSARRLELSCADIRADRRARERRWAAGLRRARGRLRARLARVVQPCLRDWAAWHGELGMSADEQSKGGAGGLDRFRVRLDEIDDALAYLLGERFQICREVARHKSEHEIAMMQPGRVEQVRARYMERGTEVDLPTEFSADLFELVIAATCKMEDQLMEAER
jgi:chorismate mutase